MFELRETKNLIPGEAAMYGVGAIILRRKTQINGL
jgi:hypothetical protein